MSLVKIEVTNDKDFEIKDDSNLKGFEHHELNDLIQLMYPT